MPGYLNSWFSDPDVVLAFSTIILLANVLVAGVPALFVFWGRRLSANFSDEAKKLIQLYSDEKDQDAVDAIIEEVPIAKLPES